MQIFLAPDFSGTDYTLNEEESKHAIRVLRMGINDKIYLIDGRGTFVEAAISVAHPKRCTVTPLRIENEYEKRNYRLHMAVSPLKHPDRFEWFLEKATEIGIDEITPILCEHTEKKSLNTERCNRIIESAMKQSIKAFHPILNPLMPFKEIINYSAENTKLIATCEGQRKFIREAYTPGENTLILIGPEGDFSKEEVDFAGSRQFKPITLGASRLRTETAAIAACHSISLLNQPYFYK